MHQLHWNQIDWQESQRDGILRGITNRVDWNKQWHITMHKPVIQNVYSISKEDPLKHSFLIPKKLCTDLIINLSNSFTK